MKHTLGVFAVATALAFAGGMASMPANAASSNGATKATSDKQAVSDTDISSHRRHWRRYGHYGYRSYGYYRPRPYYYRPYSYAYYPPPYYYRPYYRPAPVFSIGFGFGPSFGFGPRHHW
jgi:hypothetical protein